MSTVSGRENLSPATLSTADLLLLGGVLLLLGLLFYPALAGAVSVWWANESFHHGFLTLPLAGYAIARDWRHYDFSSHTPRLLSFFALLSSVSLWFLGYALDLLVIQQLAFCTLVIALVGTLYGYRLILSAWFPVSMLFFAVPMGEELVPILQDITVQISLALLNLTSIPVWQDGLYFHLPVGVFFVAEACSGVKFLIASTFMGYVLAYMFFEGLQKRIYFIVFCICLSIAANGLRVFVTILVGHYFGMGSVEGFDHLVYGWVLFALVFGLIFYVTIRFEDAPTESALTTSNAAKISEAKLPGRGAILICALTLALVAGIKWVVAPQLFVSPTQSLTTINAPTNWQPAVPGANSAGFLANKNNDNDIFVATYVGVGDLELTNFAREFKQLEGWEQVDVDWVKSLATQCRCQGFVSQNSRGIVRFTLYWYQLVDGFRGTGTLSTKFQQLRNIFAGKGRGGAFIARSMELTKSSQQPSEHQLVQLQQFVDLNSGGI